MKPTLIQMLEQYKGALALPSEPLGVTQCAEHYIKLKPNTIPVYINYYCNQTISVANCCSINYCTSCSLS